ncbi:protein no-on-transient A-like isoform X2 [Tubulanus polymorphus]|uniref:protein no-on-transient A-like isoform X2 n=1 Tax=Tubulanus polymorphus TaxID=672921 RepID=UPI003DA6562B
MASGNGTAAIGKPENAAGEDKTKNTNKSPAKKDSDAPLIANPPAAGINLPANNDLNKGGGRNERGGGVRRGGRGGGYRGNRGNFHDRKGGGGQQQRGGDHHDTDRNHGAGGGSRDFYGNNNRGGGMDRGETTSMLVEDKPKEEKKFTGRCRLFVGNLTPELEEEDFKKMFLEFGDVSEVYLNKQKGFGFIRLDTRHNAEKAKMQLDGTIRKSRILRVRFATHGAALKVRHISPFVSNELLEEAFSKFGQVERAIVIVDDRGRPSGEGIVEFARKPGAQKAMTSINDGVFLLGTSPKPIIVEPLEQKDEEDGLPEKYIQKNSGYSKEREQMPRFANTKSFEYEFGLRWKQLYEMEQKEKERLQKEMEDAVDKLEMEMSNAVHEQQANLLRQELQRLEEQRLAEEMKRREMTMRRQEDERIRREEEEAQRQHRLMRQQQQEEQFRRRQMQQSMGWQDMRKQEMADNRRQQDNRRESMRDMRGNQREREMSQDMHGWKMGNHSEAEHSNAPPMQPPPAPPAGFGLSRESSERRMW